MTEKKPIGIGRRRGSELKNAIYAAAVELLENDGYEKVTFQNVAKKAKTTRSVLYRYWDDVYQLIYEAARHHIEADPDWQGTVIDASFNSGSLRQDLIDMLVFMRENAYRFPKGFLAFVNFQQAQGRNLFDSQLPQITTGNIVIIERILARAQERGEAKENIGEMAKLLPFQISRYHFMVENNPLDASEIAKFVDEVLLPLYEKI